MSVIRHLNVRTALWHLRTGGLRQLRKYVSNTTGRWEPTSNVVRKSLLSRRVRIAPWPVADGPLRRTELRVGVILDEFSQKCFQYEWSQIPLSRNRWEEQLDEGLDLVFIESAWHGNGDEWKYKLSGVPDTTLIKILRACEQRNIPTVFWNKEDPAHFSDFIELAKHFDYVYTTDVNKLEEYRIALGHDRVAVLPFAAQAAIHNPVRIDKLHQSRDIAFAGMYFRHKFPERREQMDMLLGGALDAGKKMPIGLEIYSRFHGGDENYQFPKAFAGSVVGSLSYEQILTAYRLHKVFLNVNSVTTSESMCARRIFEISASGTPVVSSPSPAVAHFFPSNAVIEVENRETAAASLRALVKNPLLRDQIVHRAQRAIWSEHTYESRVNQVLADVGLPFGTFEPTVTMVAPTNRPHQLENILENAQRQQGVRAQLLVGTHGFELAASAQAQFRDSLPNVDVQFIHCGNDMLLGDVLNALIARADGELVAKIDDDDYYAPWYLHDQVRALSYSQAELVGKGAHFVYDQSFDTLMLKNEHLIHRVSRFVAGPTLVMSRDLAMRLPFESRSRGEDTHFINAVRSAGGRVYSADPFNFALHRKVSGNHVEHQHTWDVSSWELLANSTVITTGWNPENIIA